MIEAIIWSVLLLIFAGAATNPKPFAHPEWRQGIQGIYVGLSIASFAAAVSNWVVFLQ